MNQPLQHVTIDPVIFTIGPFDLRWYGLMYLVGLAFAWWWGNKQADRLPGWNRDMWQDLLFWGFMSLIIGGRIGYVLFYQFDQFAANPLYLFNVTGGGMSFHGGLLGVLLCLYIFARKQDMPFMRVGDFVAPLVPVGLGAGRIGNYINGELWGRVSDVPWAMVFQGGGPEARHPSQLYQAFTEGLLLFIILYLFTRAPRPTGSVGGLFLAGYGTSRFVVEYFREPDAHLGLLGLFSMGQWLSLPMIVAGVLLMVLAYRGTFGGVPQDSASSQSTKTRTKGQSKTQAAGNKAARGQSKNKTKNTKRAKK